ncbi:MAG: HNH endonuclease signature motif containing protein [Ornithinibacter sp.]
MSATVILPTAATTGHARAISLGASRVAAAIAEPGTARSRDEWLAVVADCQSLINIVTAVQDAAIAEAARRESVWCEDGTLGETVHVPGRVTLDAADVVAPVIGASHAQAERRVEQAVRLAASRVPAPADDRDLPESSGLGGLHEAMAAGQLDAYRAGVVAFELEVAPADVADAVVAALSGHLGEDSSSLRRRTRALLSRISPDLVRERAQRARANTGLRRWVAEPGVDEWHGTFPSEDAASAWAAIDRLAHDLVAAGTCTNIEQARGKALTDLVTGNATVDVQIVLTVPADSRPAPQAPEARAAATGGSAPGSSVSAGGEHVAAPVAGAVVASAAVRSDEDALDPKDIGSDDDLVEVQGSRPSEPLLVRRGWLREHLRKQRPRPKRSMREAPPQLVPCDPLTGARLDPRDDLATDAYRPGAELAALVRARDGRCRFPGCSVAARFCDLDHVRPWPTGRTTATNLLTLCRRHHRIKQRPGWRLRLAPDGSATWTDPTGLTRTTAPLNALHALVLVADPAPQTPLPDRDCRTPLPDRAAVMPLPGPAPVMPLPDRDCQTSLSDLPPVMPLPAVRPTAALPDLSSATKPVLPEPGSLTATTATSAADQSPLALTATTSVWSALETHLTFRAEHHRQRPPDHGLRTHPTHRRCTSVAELRTGLARWRVRSSVPDEPPF